MKKNTLRIVCNPYGNSISYYFKNEIGQWSVLSSSSVLSRRYFTNTTIVERAKEILKKADEIYNRKNKGLDILFEGTSDNYKYLCKVINTDFSDRNITCELGVTKIVVVGKTHVGKTSLIEGMEELQGYKYNVKENPDYFLYNDEGNHAEWYEIKGIDLGLENVDKAFQVIGELTKNGLSTIIYCVNGISGRMEDVEKDFVLKLVDSYPALTAMVVITVCIKRNQREFMDEIERITDQLKVIPTLAKAYEFDTNEESDAPTILQPYGLDALSKYVFERR